MKWFCTTFPFDISRCSFDTSTNDRKERAMARVCEFLTQYQLDPAEVKISEGVVDYQNESFGGSVTVFYLAGEQLEYVEPEPEGEDGKK